MFTTKFDKAPQSPAPCPSCKFLMQVYDDVNVCGHRATCDRENGFAEYAPSIRETESAPVPNGMPGEFKSMTTFKDQVFVCTSEGVFVYDPYSKEFNPIPFIEQK